MVVVTPHSFLSPFSVPSSEWIFLFFSSSDRRVPRRSCRTGCGISRSRTSSATSLWQRVAIASLEPLRYGRSHFLFRLCTLYTGWYLVSLSQVLILIARLCFLHGMRWDHAWFEINAESFHLCAFMISYPSDSSLGWPCESAFWVQHQHNEQFICLLESLSCVCNSYSYVNDCLLHQDAYLLISSFLKFIR